MTQEVVASTGMASCSVKHVEGLGRCLLADQDVESGMDVLGEAPLLAAGAAEIAPDLADAAQVVINAENGPWSYFMVDEAAVRRLLGLLRAYANSETEIKRSVLELDDGMEAGAAACFVRKLSALFLEWGLLPQLRKMELHTVLSLVCTLDGMIWSCNVMHVYILIELTLSFWKWVISKVVEVCRVNF